MPLLKAVLITLGTASLLIGVIGIFVPGLPTTPFLLLTSVLYVHSSDKLYKLLISNKHVGVYILNYRSNKGMTRKLKIFSICIMWLMITISCLFFIPALSIKLIVTVLGLTGSFVMGMVVPTISKPAGLKNKLFIMNNKKLTSTSGPGDSGNQNTISAWKRGLILLQKIM